MTAKTIQILLILQILLIPFSSALVSINNGGSQRITINPGIIEGFPFLESPLTSPKPGGGGFTLSQINLKRICSLSEDFIKLHTIQSQLFYTDEELSPLRELLTKEFGIELKSEEVKKALKQCALDKEGIDYTILFILLIAILGALIIMFAYRRRIINFFESSGKSLAQD